MCNQWDKDFAARALQYWSPNATVIEVGSLNVNGTVRDELQPRAGAYTGVDLTPGPGVDVVLDVANLTQHFDQEYADVVVSTEMLEHVFDWPTALAQMLLTTRLGGMLVLTTRSYGTPYHGHPTDYWRFEVEDLREIFSGVGAIWELEPDVADKGAGIILQRTASARDILAWAAEQRQRPLYHIKHDRRITLDAATELVNAATPDPRPLISLVMIVKNEQIALPDCIASVRGVVDEWIIVDTGSTDETKALIQRECGVERVHEIPFVNFVATKNEALKLATGRYVLFMDADERLLQGHAVLRAAAEAGDAAVAGKIIEGPLPTIANSYYRVRMWRNDGTWRFVGPGVHEVIVGEGQIVWHADIVVFHDHRHRTPESYAARTEHYLRLLHTALAEDPGDTRAWFYLGRTLADAGRQLEAIEAFEQYLTLDSNFRDERWQAAFDIAGCWMSHGEYAKSLLAVQRAIEIDGRRAEAYCLLGELYFRQADYRQAAAAYELAASRPIPEDVILFLDPRAYTIQPRDQLVLCYDALRHYDLALAQATAAVGLTPTVQQRLVNNLTHIRAMHDRRWLFWLGHTPEPVCGDLIERQGVGGVETTYIELPKALAAAGQTVMVACACDQPHVVDDVLFVPYDAPETHAWYQPQIVVGSRDFTAFRTTAQNVIWLQDAWFANPPEGVWGQAQQVIVSSQWHRSYLAQRAGPGVAGKATVIPLGIRKAMFAGLTLTMDKRPRQVIYSSNPDRGLETLVAAWPTICERVPDANLVVTYGWEGLRTWSQDPAWQTQQEERRARLLTWAESAGNVRFTGRLRKADLYREMAASAVCGYPNNFWETFCLTALETQAAGTPMVTTAMGALPTTLNQDCNILIEGNPFGDAYRETFARELSALLLDDERRQTYAAACRQHIERTACDWTDVAQSWLRMIWAL